MNAGKDVKKYYFLPVIILVRLIIKHIKKKILNVKL